jgi:hypothetical protein
MSASRIYTVPVLDRDYEQSFRVAGATAADAGPEMVISMKNERGSIGFNLLASLISAETMTREMCVQAEQDGHKDAVLTYDLLRDIHDASADETDAAIRRFFAMSCLKEDVRVEFLAMALKLFTGSKGFWDATKRADFPAKALMDTIRPQAEMMRHEIAQHGLKAVRMRWSKKGFEFSVWAGKH